MKKLCVLALCLMLTSCYYDGETGCVQHLNYRECPYIDTDTLSKVSADAHQKYLDYDECVKQTNSQKTLYNCMVDKGYRPIVMQ